MAKVQFKRYQSYQPSIGTSTHRTVKFVIVDGKRTGSVEQNKETGMYLYCDDAHGTEWRKYRISGCRTLTDLKFAISELFF